MRPIYVLFVVLTVFGLAAAGCSSAAPTNAPPATSAPSAQQPPAQPAAAVASTAAPAAAPSSKIVRGGQVTVGLDADLTTMDPHFSSAAVDRQVYQLIYNPLVRLEKDLTIKPELATKWEFTDPTTLVMTLQKGIKFHDGTDFNAQAVKVNLDRILDPNNKSPRASEIASVKEVQTPDDYTVKLLLKNPDAALMAQFTDRAGMIISPAAIAKYGKDLARNPVGTGPFKYVEWVKDDHLAVTKFDGYWEKGEDGQPLPYLDAVTIKPVTDATVRLTSLKTGTLDIINQVAPKDASALRQQKDLMFDEVPSLGYQMLALNNKKAPFDKVEARQAVAYAIDRAAIVKNLLYDTATAGQGPIPPSSWAYDDSVNKIYTRDVNKSKELLQKAGLTLPVQFSCYVTNSPEAIRIGQAYKEMLSEGGFDMQLELMEFGTALAKYNNFEHTCFQVGWTGRSDPDGNVYSYLKTGGGLNRDQYSNPTVDSMLDQARTVYGQPERKKLYTDAITIAVKDAAYVYLYWPLDQKTWNPKLQGFVHVPDGMIRLKSAWLQK